MKKIILLFIYFSTTVTFAKETIQRKTAGDYKRGFDMYEADHCGMLNRIRFESEGTVVRLEIGAMEINFSRSIINYDQSTLSAALGNKNINVCYYQKGDRDLPMLEFRKK